MHTVLYSPHVEDFLEKTIPIIFVLDVLPFSFLVGPPFFTSFPIFRAVTGRHFPVVHLDVECITDSSRCFLFVRASLPFPFSLLPRSHTHTVHSQPVSHLPLHRSLVVCRAFCRYSYSSGLDARQLAVCCLDAHSCGHSSTPRVVMPLSFQCHLYFSAQYTYTWYAYAR